MNYYPHHIGDYLTATAHLTWLEDAAYRRLIDVYYTREQPLPLDLAQACRLVRASSKDERKAVETVLNEFFVMADDGWRHARCDREIEKASVAKRAAQNNGKKGGRPPKAKPSENPEKTQWVSDGLAEQNPEKSEVKAPNPNPNTQIKEHTSASADLPARFADFWSAWPPTDRKVAKAKCAQVWRRQKLDAVADPILSHVEAMKQTKQWQDGYEPAPLTYLNQRRWEDGVAASAMPANHWEGAI